MKTTRRRTNNAASLTAATFLLLVFCLWRPAEVRAQWTTSGNNINNTNTGNVGVGTSNPANGKVEIVSDDGAAAGEHSLLYGSRSGTSSGGIKFGYRADGTNVTGGFVRSLNNQPFFIGTTGVPLALTIDNSGNVGIGTTSPTRLFELSASSTNTSTFMASTAALSVFNTNTTAGNTADLTYRTFDSGGTAVTPAKVVAVFTNHTAGAVSGDLAFVTMTGSAGVERMRITGTGNVGIGTASPAQALTVVGYNNNSYGYAMQIVGTAPAGSVQNQLNITSTANAWGLMIGANNSGVSPSYYHCANCAHVVNYNNAPLIFGTNNAEQMRIDASGNVGIGTATPNSAYKLDVSGSVNSTGLCIGGVCKTDWSQVGGASQWTTSGTNVYYNTGSVGIGTAAPASWRKLHVLGGNVEGQWSTAAGQGYGFFIARDNNHFVENAYYDGTAWRAIQSGKSSIIQTYTFGGYALYVQADDTVRAADAARTFSPVFAVKMDGSLGIGTMTPLQKIQVGSNTAAATTTPDAISLGATYSSVAGANPKLRLWDNNAGAVYGLGVSNGQLDFMLPTGARYVWNINGVEKMRLDASGNVGIGTATPGSNYKLDVNGQAHVSGDMTVDGNIAAKYQDVAEWVPSSQKLAPGTVVVLDESKINHVVASSTAYDMKVAGVVSAEPGVILGVAGEDKLKVATTGRVKVKVDATRGAIKVGDLLVTSDVEGVAMRSEPVVVSGRKRHAPGTIIGKALEPLENGAGEILVLLSLQ
ncbi:MAG: hypothetical protein ACJ74T_00990 [Pyrinomonadaceae bacterium]